MHLKAVNVANTNVIIICTHPVNVIFRGTNYIQMYSLGKSPSALFTMRQTKACPEPCHTSKIERLCENSSRRKADNYFRKKLHLRYLTSETVTEWIKAIKSNRKNFP